MTKISRVAFDGNVFKLAIPVYLSDDETSFANKIYDREGAAAAADAFFLFNIVQKQIEQLMARMENGEVRQPKDDTSHPFADDVLMGGD